MQLINKPRINLVILLLALALQSCASMSKTIICDEKTGRSAVAAGEHEIAFDSLKGCEPLEAASGEALAQLAALNAAGFGEFESDKARHTKYYELMHRSALKLYPNAIETLISFYQKGDAIVPQEPRMDVASCLANLLDSGQGNKKQVFTCLTL